MTQERTSATPAPVVFVSTAAPKPCDSGPRPTLHPPLETSPELLALIERAKSHKMTPEEIDAQRRSWVRGQMGLSDPTRTPEQIDAALDAVLGPPLSAQLAAAREAGRLEGDAAGYRRGMEEAAQIAERVTSFSDNLQKSAGLLTTGEAIAAAIRAKLEGK